MALNKRLQELRNDLQTNNLHLIDEIEKEYIAELENLELKYNKKIDILLSTRLDACLQECIMAELKWPEIQSQIKTRIFELAVEKYGSQEKAAAALGIGRTTILEHFKKTRKL